MLKDLYIDEENALTVLWLRWFRRDV